MEYKEIPDIIINNLDLTKRLLRFCINRFSLDSFPCSNAEMEIMKDLIFVLSDMNLLEFTLLPDDKYTPYSRSQFFSKRTTQQGIEFLKYIESQSNKLKS